MLLYIEPAAAHTRVRKQKTTFSGRAFYWYAASIFRGQRSMHSTTCEKHPLNINAFLLTEMPQMMTCSLLERTMYSNTMSLFLYDSKNRKETLADRAKACAQRVARTVKKNFSLGEGVAPLARATEKSTPPATPRDFGRPRMRGSIQSIWLELRLAPRTPPHRKGRSSHADEGFRVITSISGSGTGREKKPAKSRRKRSGWK